MNARNIFPVLCFRSIRKTFLSVLIGSMSGVVSVYAQQPSDAPPSAPVAASATASTDSDLIPATPEAAPAANASATAAPASAADTTPAAATDASAAAATPAPTTDGTTGDLLVKAGFKPATEPPSVVIGADGKAVDEPMDAATAKKVKKLRDKFRGKGKQPKLTPVNIVQGTLTLDGWTGKARMNYDIADLKFLYVWAPGVGTVVISQGWFEAGDIQLHAFSGNTLTVNADGHIIQVTSEKPMLPKKQTSAFVYVDKSYTVASSFPVMGYGNSDHPPYAWPGAKNVQVAKVGGLVPPPLPKDLRPILAVAGCVPEGSKAALGQTPCTPAMEAARRKQVAEAEAKAAAAKQTASSTAQPVLQTR